MKYMPNIEYNRNYLAYSIRLQLTIPMSQTPLSLKLQLLQALRNGQVQQIQTLITKIKDVTKINPQLYHKFGKFISQNKEGCNIIQMRREEKEQIAPEHIVIENVDGDIDDGYKSDDSWSLSSEDEQQQPIQIKDKRPVLTQVNNKPTPSKATQNQSIRKDKPTPTNPSLAFKKTTTTPSATTNLQTKNIRPRN